MDCKGVIKLYFDKDEAIPCHYDLDEEVIYRKLLRLLDYYINNLSLPSRRFSRALRSLLSKRVFVLVNIISISLILKLQSIRRRI